MKGAIVAAAGLCLMAGTAVAQTAVETQTIPAAKLFPFLDTYLNIPAAQRDHFRMEYALVGGPASNARLTLKRPSGDMAVALAADGRILTEPSLADLKDAKVVMVTPKGSHYGISLRIVASETPAQVMDVAPLKLGIDQARTAAKKAAGLMSMVVPDFQTVCFAGAGSGSATLADGSSVALRITAPPSNPKWLNPCLTPADIPQARRVTLAHVPSSILIMRRPAG